MVLKWKRWVCLHAHMSNPQHMGIIIILKYHIYAYGSPSHIFFVFCYIDIYYDIIFDIIRLHGVQKKMEHLQFHVWWCWIYYQHVSVMYYDTLIISLIKINVEHKFEFMELLPSKFLKVIILNRFPISTFWQLYLVI